MLQHMSTTPKCFGVIVVSNDLPPKFKVRMLVHIPLCTLMETLHTYIHTYILTYIHRYVRTYIRTYM